ncbi:Uncharacterized protein ALO83_00118 [Pseudomonas cannabina pv. alisalensis]|uniref:Uncharacterized protein n=3 Tax=Pseudomonas syringae group TaxID=136849 RepID=A0A3M3QLK2_PSECA|nr:MULTISPECIES: hypothetical protein [Pseudomonas syringae group]KPW23910.1 Uncharacterized protein ALO83_00118 [Pseudomonas cannabina pv. alisalensis]MBM0140157.1 hypothetical protein [Pseudomonas cannabina pv. alisalensis]QHE96816.1 hypothetical protein PMA4326_009415 [Pseudomonas syringae pv. maculicola str. ES4326]RMN77521.1 hypothetical protein ALQ52_103476 [Pseudomonas cannabina pv. alisalensis]RMN85106.1 hypothetical protein ALQ53_102754 [Pseudomonas cannabina]
MTLKSDTEALEAIAEEAEILNLLLENFEGPNHAELLAVVRQIIAIARYREALGHVEGFQRNG